MIPAVYWYCLVLVALLAGAWCYAAGLRAREWQHQRELAERDRQIAQLLAITDREWRHARELAERDRQITKLLTITETTADVAQQALSERDELWVEYTDYRREQEQDEWLPRADT